LLFARIIKLEGSPATPGSEPSKVTVRHFQQAWSDTATGAMAHKVSPETAYDESDDVQYYRRVQIVSRKRRKLWHDPAPVDIECDTNMRDTAETSKEVSNLRHTHGQKSDEIDGFEELSDILDKATFKQLLEMDGDFDDDDERAFSREICLGQFACLEVTLEQMRPLVYAPDSSLRELSSWGHFIKGTPYTTGLHKMGETAWEIQFVGAMDARDEWRPEHLRHIKTEEDIRRFIRGNYESFWEQLKIARVKLQDFYKVPPGQR
jgi:osomolarity two-component system phosphorelay intermediate protein YPD1